MSSDDPGSKRCPICTHLPIAEVASGHDLDPLIYSFNVETIQQLLDSKIEEQFSGHCDLYRTARFILDFWSKRHDVEQSSDWKMLGVQCDGSKGVVIMTDADSKVDVLPSLYQSYDMSRLARPVYENPLDAHLLARIQGWREECVRNHRQCSLDENAALPTRVIDVEDLKVIETTEGQKQPYVALSHCWGLPTKESFITTRDNFDDMKKGFVLDDAPKTFRDAIEVTRALGIRYLWIDSLCIIQQDAEDWQRESSKMGSVYRGSTITIAAMEALSDSEGFLKMRPRTHTTLKFISSDGLEAEVYLRSKDKASWQYWDHRSKNYPLNARGWCLQEAYLAKRTLRYTSTKLIWRCKTVEWEESTLPRGHAASDPWSLENIYNNGRLSAHRTLNNMTPYTEWYRMISEFSNRALTHASDKLPAISGLASLVAEHDKELYCAGIWWTDIAYGMCWKKCRRLQRETEYIAPSWSWASVRGAVEFIEAHDTMYAQSPASMLTQTKIVEFHSVKHGHNEYGQIDFAWLSLEAPLYALKKVEGATYQFDVATATETLDISFDIDEMYEGDTQLQALFLMCRQDTKEYQAIMNGGSKDIKKTVLFGIVVRPALQLREKCRDSGLGDIANTRPVYERIGFVRLMTVNERVQNYWDRGSVPVVLV